MQSIKGIICYGICGTKRSSQIADGLKKRYNMKLAVCNYRELLESEADTIYIASPNHLHYEMTLQAIEHDKHVIVEKPTASNYEEVKQLSLAARERGIFFFEAITTRYQPNYLYIKEKIKQIGTIQLVTCNFSQYFSRYQRRSLVFLSGLSGCVSRGKGFQSKGRIPDTGK